MPKKLFRRLAVSPDVIHQQKGLGFLAEKLSNPSLWHLNRRSVSWAFAIGLFVMWLPMPFQSLISAVLAVFWRVNLPISVALVFVSNPFTMFPMLYSAYYLGTTVLGLDMINSFVPEMSWEWWSHEFRTIGKPLLLGIFMMAILSSVVGYWVIRWFWYWNIRYRAHKRKQRSCNQQKS